MASMSPIHPLTSKDAATHRPILGGDCMARKYQNGKLQIRSDVSRPYWFIRVTKPVIDERSGERVKKRVDEKLGFTDEISRDQAMKLRAQKLDEVNSNRMLAPSLVRFSDLATRYLKTRATTHSSATRAWEETQIENHIVPAFGALRLSEIDRLAVEQWLAAKPHLSWWTKDGLRRLLARIFTAAEEWGWFEGKKPTLGIRLGRKKLVYEKKLLTVPQFRLLLAALDEEMRFLVLILFCLGLRVSEALGLRWKDLTWDAQTISLERRWHRGDLSEAMKTEGSADTLRLSASMLAEFERRRSKPDDFLFIGEKGNPPDDRDLGRERLRPVMKRLGIYTKGNLWHQFRRAHVTYKQQVGATPMEAQKSARHASLDMTMLYTLTDAERETAQQQAMFDKLMEGGTKQ
jgi:integrase